MRSSLAERMIAPPPTIKNVQLWRKDCRKVRALAQRIIDGQVGVIEGSIQMGAFQTWLHATEDKDFKVFRAVYSDSTDLPIGDVRKFWDPTALNKKDQMIHEVEERYRRSVIEAAQRIKEKYEGIDNRANKPVDATARSPIDEPTSTPPTQHL